MVTVLATPVVTSHTLETPVLCGHCLHFPLGLSSTNRGSTPTHPEDLLTYVSLILGYFLNLLGNVHKAVTAGCWGQPDTEVLAYQGPCPSQTRAENPSES